MPRESESQSLTDYGRIEKAIIYLQVHGLEHPDLAQIARHLHLSRFHFHRLFVRWAGVSPSLFLGQLTRSAARERLQLGFSILETTLDLGLTSPSRLHDLFIRTDGMTPGEVKTFGSGLELHYGEVSTAFGRALIAWTHRGICGLRFLHARPSREEMKDLFRSWPGATWRQNPAEARAKAKTLFVGRPDLHLRGTAFQLHVWRALLEIPEGALTSYQTLGRLIGCPRASRAIGNAVGHNPIAYLIPCHRVIRESGVFGQYRWGTARKLVLTAREGVRRKVTRAGAGMPADAGMQSEF